MKLSHNSIVLKVTFISIQIICTICLHMLHYCSFLIMKRTSFTINRLKRQIVQNAMNDLPFFTIKSLNQPVPSHVQVNARRNSALAIELQQQ